MAWSGARENGAGASDVGSIPVGVISAMARYVHHMVPARSVFTVLHFVL
jgi:hypothetical protein